MQVKVMFRNPPKMGHVNLSTFPCDDTKKPTSQAHADADASWRYSLKVVFGVFGCTVQQWKFKKNEPKLGLPNG